MNSDSARFSLSLLLHCSFEESPSNSERVMFGKLGKAAQ